MKQRYTSLDLRVISYELSQTLIGFRLSNIYDISSRVFLLKFALPNSKHLLLIDSGFRCHLTSFSRTTSPSPSSFVTRLRKHLRTRRLTSVRQLGTDRVLEFVFSEGKYRLYLEFYAAGNVILVNEEGICISVLRIVPEGEGRSETKVGALYSAPDGRENTIMDCMFTREMVTELLKTPLPAPGEEEGAEASAIPEQGVKSKSGQGKKYKKKKGDNSLKRFLSLKIAEFSPALIEHVLTVVDMNLETPAEEVLKDNILIEKVFQAFIEAQKVLQSLTNPIAKVNGYIIAKKRKSLPIQEEVKGKLKGKSLNRLAFGELDMILGEEDAEENSPEAKTDDEGYRYDGFHPFLPKQFCDSPHYKVINVEGYNDTVDKFYSSIESQKLTGRVEERKISAAKKLTSARSEHQSRVSALQLVQTLNERKAQAIEANLDKVEEAIASVNSLLWQGVDWKGIETMVANARSAGNPVAELVGGLKLAEGVVTLLLVEEGPEGEDSDEEGENVSESEGESDNEVAKMKKELERLRIDVKLALTGWANAREYYSERKTAAVKEEKTIKASSKALKNTERKVLADLKKGLKIEDQLLRPVRQQMWFEKFYFFLSTDGYLVLGGRDALQTELLYERYFNRGDVLVTADIDGAATLVVKNHYTGLQSQRASVPPPVPPTTLSQAGTFSICASKAWETKAVLSAWWVSWEQVTKTLKESNYYIEEPGKFNITGVKNYLPPAQLALGYAVLWVIGETNKATVDETQFTAHMEASLNQEGERYEEKEDGEDEKEKANQEENEAEEDSDDEEFPDVQIQSEGEESDKDVAEVVPREPKGDEPEEAQSLTPSGIIAKAQKEGVNGGLGSQDATTSHPPPTGKKHLSSKERRNLQKSTSGQVTMSLSPVSSPASPAVMSASSSKSSTSQVQVPRGKKIHSKHKRKLAEKYALLSDDEREIARELLGIGSTVPSGVTSSINTADGKAPSTKDDRASEEVAARQRKQEQHLRAQALGKAAEARRFGWALPETIPDLGTVGLDKDGDGDAGEGTQGQAAIAMNLSLDLDRFTGIPPTAASIIDAIPLCAPYSALGNYKYKVKFLPAIGGASKEVQKKNKAVGDIVGSWVRLGEPARPNAGGKAGVGGGIGKGRGVGMGFEGWDEQGVDIDKMWPREWELLKNWRTSEGLNCIPVSRVKVIGGLSKSKGEGVKGGKDGKSGKSGKEAKKKK